jgi:electron transfer flavoprotein alpha subunit
MNGDIWVIAENWRGELTDAAFETLALGRELADGLGGGLTAIVIGGGDPPAAGLGLADAVLILEAPDPVESAWDAACRKLAELMAERGPAGVLVALTNASWDLAGLLPAVSGAAFVNSCGELAVADGGIEATCVMYGGKLEATVRPTSETVIYGVLPGVRKAETGRADGSPAVETVPLEVSAPAVRFVEYIEPEAGDVDITRQDALICVGRGVGGEANLDLAEDLAELLGGAVCGSRPAIDQGWLPLSRQVGKSGSTVKPRLYVALGVSGAPEHAEGMRDSDLIIAVNTDPDAPIFRVAQFGVEADLLEVVPELIDLLEKAGEG